MKLNVLSYISNLPSKLSSKKKDDGYFGDVLLSKQSQVGNGALYTHDFKSPHMRDALGASNQQGVPKDRAAFDREIAKSEEFAKNFANLYGDVAQNLGRSHFQGLQKITSGLNEGTLSLNTAFQRLSDFHSDPSMVASYRRVAYYTIEPIAEPELGNNFGDDFITDASADVWMPQKTYDTLYGWMTAPIKTYSRMALLRVLPRSITL